MLKHLKIFPTFLSEITDLSTARCTNKMGRRRNLNGLPNSLTESYLRSLTYCDSGLIGSWIWKRASEMGVTAIEIDIITEKVEPSKMHSKAVVSSLIKLRETIAKTLTQNEFDTQFIQKATLKIKISERKTNVNHIFCQGIIEDMSGRIYEGKTYRERAYPVADTLFEKIIREQNQPSL